MSIVAIPRWMILLLGAGLILFGIAASQGWLRDPTLAKSDYVGTIEVSAEEAKLYRAVPFEWRVESRGAPFTGKDTAYVRVDLSGERPVLCGWLLLDKAGQSLRAARWLSEARLAVGPLKVSALFIAPVEKPAGAGLNAGCARLDDSAPPADAPLSLEGFAVRE